MRGVRFTKAELETLRSILDIKAHDWSVLGTKAAARCEAILDKLDRADMPVKSHGLPLTEALAAFREVLGNRLITPPSGANGVYAQMTTRLAALGLSRMDCVTIAKTAGVEWQGRIKAESLVRQADGLLSSAQMTVPGTQPRGTPRTTAPVELGDDDI